MSPTLTGPYPPVLVRAGEAEHLDLIGHVLLAYGSATAGALSSHRVALGRGADGAVPHRAQAGGRHRHPTEPGSRADAGAKLEIIRGSARSSYGVGPAA